MCDKARYPSYKVAATHIRLIKRRASGRTPKRAYWCEHCHSWHLTSIKHKIEKAND